MPYKYRIDILLYSVYDVIHASERKYYQYTKVQGSIHTAIIN